MSTERFQKRRCVVNTQHHHMIAKERRDQTSAPNLVGSKLTESSHASKPAESCWPGKAKRCLAYSKASETHVKSPAPPKGKMPSTGLTDTFLSYLPFDCQRHQTQKIQTKLIYIVLNPTHVESKRMDTPEIDATCDISTI